MAIIDPNKSNQELREVMILLLLSNNKEFRLKLLRMLLFVLIALFSVITTCILPRVIFVK